MSTKKAYLKTQGKEVEEDSKTNNNDIDRLDEYVSGKVMDKVYGILKAYGFDCNSQEDDIIDFLTKNSKKLKYHEIEELAKEFFDDNCDRHLLFKMFSPKKKKMF